VGGRKKATDLFGLPAKARAIPIFDSGSLPVLASFAKAEIDFAN
jgi:hypothetical protein